MRRATNLLISALTLFLITFFSSCASSGLLSPPELASRTLRISPNLAGLEYQYPKCTRWFLGFCTGSVMHVESYDLAKDEVRKQLIDMAFVCRVRENP